MCIVTTNDTREQEGVMEAEQDNRETKREIEREGVSGIQAERWSFERDEKGEKGA